MAELILLLATTALAADFSGQEDPVEPAFSVYATDFPSDAGGPSALLSSVVELFSRHSPAAAHSGHARSSGSTSNQPGPSYCRECQRPYAWYSRPHSWHST